MTLCVIDRNDYPKDIDAYMRHLESLTPPPDFQFKTKPDPHQIEWFIEMMNRDKVILGDPMGLGKTKEYLDVCEHRKQTRGYLKTLFICKSKHKDNMAKEIETHTDSKYLIIDGKESKRLQTMRDFYYQEDIYYLIIGYEMAETHSKHLKTLARKLGFDAVIMDEFNKIKNWGTQSPRQKQQNPKKKPHITISITKLVEVINPELLILGSGTPMTKNPTDLYAPLRLIGAQELSATAYKRQFCKLDHWGGVRGTKNEDTLREILKKNMIRRPKDLLKLPEKRVQNIPVKMTEQQARLYEAAKKGIKEELRGTKVYTAKHLALLTRLRQITTNPKLVDADIIGIKDLVLEELLEDVIDGGEKAVIYSIYREHTLHLKELLSRYNPAYIDGTINSKKALGEVTRLQEDPETKILIGSLHASKESYTMTAANFGYFVDLSWTVTDNEQAEDRLHRRGQTGIVQIGRLYCEGTIDERVLSLLKSDAKSIESIVGGSERTKLSQEVFDYLLN